MARVQILYWKEIPAQIKVSEPGKRAVSHPLPPVYQQRIDALAMKLGLHGSDAYLDQWQWGDPQEIEGTAEDVAARLLKKFEEEA